MGPSCPACLPCCLHCLGACLSQRPITRWLVGRLAHGHWLGGPGPSAAPLLCTSLPSCLHSFALPAAVDFRYSDPERGFDRSRVKGVVAKLTRVADPATSTALEVVAGGKLYQVGGVTGAIRCPALACLVHRGPTNGRICMLPTRRGPQQAVPVHAKP